jgi:hypothetical protein
MMLKYFESAQYPYTRLNFFGFIFQPKKDIDNPWVD